MIWVTITLALLVVATFLNMIVLYLKVGFDNTASLVDSQEIVTNEEAELSEFDKRIIAFQKELNTPTYADNVARTEHPAVYNVPHDEITDTPLRYEEEYAE